MTILTLANSKCGGGKTTIAACLAVELSRRGKQVVLLDADPQRSLTGCVLNTATRTALVSHIRNELISAGISVMGCEIGQRTACAESELAGSSPCLTFFLSAPDARSNTYIGSGVASCGEWLASSRDMRVHRQNWVMGYLSGLNSDLSEPMTAECLLCLVQECHKRPYVDFLAEHDADGIAAAIDKYCRENPLKKVINAADDVARQMRRMER